MAAAMAAAARGDNLPEVPSVQAALAAVAAGEFDVVLLDIKMPGMDGFEICERVRAAGCRVPILFLTARSARERVSEQNLRMVWRQQRPNMYVHQAT